MQLLNTFAVILLIYGSASLAASAQAADAAGRVASTYGLVSISSNAQSPWRRVYKGELIFPGDEIKTDSSSGVSLVLEDESLVKLGPHSVFKVEQVSISSFWRSATALVTGLTQSVQSTFQLLSGRMWMRNNNRNINTQVITTVATIGIRGTELTIEVDGDRNIIEVQEGAVLAQMEIGEESAGNGEQIIIEAERSISRSVVVRQRDAVQWTVAIPPIINIASLLPDPARSSLRRQLAELFEKSEFAAMSQVIEQQNLQSTDNDLWLALDSWISLHSGDSWLAHRNLSDRLARPDAPLIIQELAAFAAIVNQEFGQAQEILSRLQQQHRLSSNGNVIYGYLEQSRFDLQAAIGHYRDALQTDPENIIARLQLARVLFGSDSNQAALAEVNQALQQDSDNLAAINLLGFLRLANLETANAISTWDKVTDRANADTHFGLSLAYMRQGKIGLAFENIATAVVLDPQQSIYLSYWGKMLHQVERYDRALTVLNSAIRLDSNDPTPLLYRAIILRDLNRPGEAINDLQLATQLNNNKGIYRSRSLLDKDLAVQNVDLSRLFNQLGLSNWAHNKAIASIKSNYTNVSAHILNAGAFAELEDRSFPLMSSALLARILQPANTNAFSSFNNYTSMYETPDVEHVLDIGAGNQEQRSLGYIVYGANPESHTAWSAAAVHDSSEGWRETNGHSFNDISFIGKWQPDQESNYLFTLSAFETNIKDDLYPRFEIDAPVDPLADFTSRNLLLELGLYERLSKRHDLLLHLSLLQNEGEITDNVVDQEIPVGSVILTQERIVDGDFERPAAQFQLQGIIKQNANQIIYGALLATGKQKIDATEDYGLFGPDGMLIDPLAGFDEQTINSLDTSFAGVYIQDSWQFTPAALLDVAIYHETMDNANALTGGEWTIEETSPRLGLILNASSHQTFRFAAFQYLLPFVSARLDPVDVAGIPIYRNAHEGSLVREADIVWEYESNQGLFSINAYKLEEEFTSSILVSGQQIESTSESEKEGLVMTGDWLLGLRSGLRAEIEGFETSNQSLPETDRDEARLLLRYSHVFNNSFTF